MISLAVTEILIKRVFFRAVQLRVLCTHQHLATSFWLQALDQSSGAAALSKPPEEDDLQFFSETPASMNFGKARRITLPLFGCCDKSFYLLQCRYTQPGTAPLHCQNGYQHATDRCYSLLFSLPPASVGPRTWTLAQCTPTHSNDFSANTSKAL